MRRAGGRRIYCMKPMEIGSASEDPFRQEDRKARAKSSYSGDWLDRLDDRTVANELVKRLAKLSPQLRSEAVAVLVKRAERAVSLLHAIEVGSLRADVLSPVQALALRTHRDPELKALAKRVLAQAI